MTGKQQTALVAGGGLAGLAAAWKLVEAGCAVTVVEPSKRFGGINNSKPWRGHHLDFGCHLFGNETPEATRLLIEMAGGDVTPVQPRFASRCCGAISEDLEYPDFTRADETTRDAALGGLVRAAFNEDDSPPDTLADLLRMRFGAGAAGLLEPALKKMLRAAPGELSARAAPALPVRRVVLAGSREADALKTLPELDDRLARKWDGDPMRFHGHVSEVFPARAFYPKAGGMGGFTAAAVAGLKERGAVLRTQTGVEHLETKADGRIHARLSGGEQADADLMIWTAGPADLAAALGLDLDFGALVHATPMAVFYFETDAPAPGARHYAVDYDDDTALFRASRPAAWADGVSPQGSSYLCCEVPTDIGSPIWENPDAHAGEIWNAAKRLGMAEGAPGEHVVLKAPATYKLPKAGFEASERVLLEAGSDHPALRYIDPYLFAKARIVSTLNEAIAEARGEARAAS